MLSNWKLHNAVQHGLVSSPLFSEFPMPDGSTIWQAVCSAKEGLISDEVKLFLYQGAGGSGSDKSQSIAAAKAVCEVLERIAYYSARLDPFLRRKYFFDVDDSTNGMAAFPELFCWAVKKIAYREALERWAIRSWWFGRLQADPLDLGKELKGVCIRTATPFHVVILWKSSNLRAYGFSCESDLGRAIFRASVELSRNEIVLNHWNGEQLPSEVSILERRLVYFAQTEGQRLFDSKVKSSNREKCISQLPEILFDGEIHGKWSRFAKVWRTVFKVDKEWLNQEQIDIFHF